MSVVLDASATIAWHFDDESTPAVRSLLMHVAGNGAIVPSLWRYEVANVLTIAVRRGRIDQDYQARALANLAALPIDVDTSADHHVWTAVVETAALHRLCVYDAAYLQLAVTRRLPLATLDRVLGMAAQRSGVSLFLPVRP